MNKKLMTIAALAIGAIGMTATLSTAKAGIASAGLNIAETGKTNIVTKIGHRMKRVRRHHRRHHARIHNQRHRGWRHNRRHRWNGYYGFGYYSAYAARPGSCRYYRYKARQTGYRHWWAKYNRCVTGI